MIAEELISFRKNFGPAVSPLKRGCMRSARSGRLGHSLPRGLPLQKHYRRFKTSWPGKKALMTGVSSPTTNPLSP